MHFCHKALAICKISHQINLKWRNSKQKKISNYVISKESYRSLKILQMFNEFIQIHSLLSPKRSLSFTCNSLLKHNNMGMVMHSQMAKIKPSSVKIWRT